MYFDSIFFSFQICVAAECNCLYAKTGHKHENEQWVHDRSIEKANENEMKKK